MREEEEGRQQRGQQREQQQYQNIFREQNGKNRPTRFSKVNFCPVKKVTEPDHSFDIRVSSRNPLLIC